MIETSEIAAFLNKAGVSNDLNGFHVCLAINKFSHRNIIQLHYLKLPGDDEERNYTFAYLLLLMQKHQICSALVTPDDTFVMLSHVLLT